MDLKDKIYSELSKHRGEYISGQTLAKLFGVSTLYDTLKLLNKQTKE